MDPAAFIPNCTDTLIKSLEKRKALLNSGEEKNVEIFAGY
jgi:hypothetical protein